ncbi:MAG: FAD-binding oxidoreductase [Bacteroidetes bacterium]|nr:FAD-binding oxidoreductase [Bacteroidota bacterium]
MQFSIWEKHYVSKPDIVVLGNGIVGLQCAIHLKLKYPKRRIWVIDRAPFSMGASMRNAGFACFGSAGEILDDIHRTSEEAAFNLYAQRYTGLKYLTEDFGAEKIGYEKTGGYEIFPTAQDAELQKVKQHLHEINEHLKEVTGEIPFVVKSSTALGMNVLPEAIYTPLEGAIQTDLLYKNIREKAQECGVEIYSGIEVVALETDALTYWTLHTTSGLSIQCKRLVVCTNGFAKKLLPELNVQPARGQVLVTSTIPGLRWRGLMHAEQGYYYFRSLGTRILIGGARHLDKEEETSYELETNENLQNELKRFLNEVVIPGENFEITHQWAGIMGMADDRSPLVAEHKPGLFICLRMGGMGVALSALVSRRLAEMVTGL